MKTFKMWSQRWIGLVALIEGSSCCNLNDNVYEKLLEKSDSNKASQRDESVTLLVTPIWYYDLFQRDGLMEYDFTQGCVRITCNLYVTLCMISRIRNHLWMSCKKSYDVWKIARVDGCVPMTLYDVAIISYNC